MAKYALKDINKPIGISRYIKKVVNLCLKSEKANFPQVVRKLKQNKKQKLPRLKKDLVERRTTTMLFFNNFFKS